MALGWSESAHNPALSEGLTAGQASDSLQSKLDTQFTIQQKHLTEVIVLSVSKSRTFSTKLVNTEPWLSGLGFSSAA